jgi:anti-sigma B factor antagonist
LDPQSKTATENTASPPEATTVDITEKWIDRVVVVSVSGVVDMLTAPQLDAAIEAAMEQKPAALVVDFTNVDFLASAGMGVLVATHDRSGPDIRFSVVADGPATSRPLKLVGIADIVALYATLDEALAGMSA